MWGLENAYRDQVTPKLDELRAMLARLLDLVKKKEEEKK
jgi:hypothetical protein